MYVVVSSRSADILEKYPQANKHWVYWLIVVHEWIWWALKLPSDLLVCGLQFNMHSAKGSK